MEIGELKILFKYIADTRHSYLSPVEVYLADKKNPKLLQLYKCILNGKVKNHSEAAEFILGKSASDKEYNSLKNQLMERISVLALEIDPEKALKAMASRHIFRSYRYLFAGMFLYRIPATIILADEFLNKSVVKGDFINDPLVTMLSSFWKSDLNALKNQPEEFYENKKQFNISLKRFADESKLRLYESELNLIQSGSHMTQYRFVSKAKKYYLEAKKIHEQYQSYHTYLTYAIIGIRYGFFSKNYDLVIEMANLRDELFIKHPQYVSYYLTSMTSTYRMIAYMYLRKYEEGKQEARVMISKMKTGNRDWLAILEYYFLLCMHSGNYEQALNVYYDVFKSVYYQSLNPEYQERWKYFEPYLNFIIPDQFPKESINLLGFLDEMSYYTSHKGDNNIIIMVGQIIVMMDMDEFEKLAERTTYLESYIKKYVEKKIYPRTWIFLNMMLKLFKNNFNAKKTSMQVDKQFQMLTPFEGNPLYCIDGIEVIPYDTLWQDIIKKLFKKQSRA